MPQISLYVTEPDLAKIEDAAARANTSISKWVLSKVLPHLEPVYPLGYEDLFGSVEDKTFTRPPQGSFSDDAKREAL